KTELVSDGERAVAADRDERVESHLVEHVDHALAVRARAVRGLHDRIEGIARVDRAENRPAEPQDAGDVARRNDARSIEFEEAVVAVFETETTDAAVPRRFHDGADDGVQTGRVTAAGENADAFDGSHGGVLRV